jgi:hypothetical protein
MADSGYFSKIPALGLWASKRAGAKSEIRNPKAEIGKLAGIGSALNTQAPGASLSRDYRTE